MKRWHRYLMGVWVLWLMGCGGVLPATRPPDFQISVSESGGMLPLGERITLSAEGGTRSIWVQGQAILIEHAVDTAALDTLYASLRENQTHRIRTTEEEGVYDRGGTSLSFTADGQTYAISDSGQSFVRPTWQSAFSASVQAVNEAIAHDTDGTAVPLVIAWEGSGLQELRLDVGAAYRGVLPVSTADSQITILLAEPVPPLILNVGGDNGPTSTYTIAWPTERGVRIRWAGGTAVFDGLTP